MQVTFNITRGHTIALFKVITLGLLLGFGIQFLFAWTAPTAVAPGGNVDGPLTVGAANQIKTGGLNLGALTVVGGVSIGTAPGLDNLCLNGICITAWPTGGDNLGNHLATMNINMAGRQVTNLGATTNPSDAATKAYVDAKSGFSSCHLVKYSYGSPPAWTVSNFTGIPSAALCPVGEIAVGASCGSHGAPAAGTPPYGVACELFTGGNVSGRSGVDLYQPTLHDIVTITCCPA